MEDKEGIIDIADESCMEEIELDIFIHAVRKLTGYDMSNYARASLMRRVKSHQQRSGLETISELIPKLVASADFRKNIINNLTVCVSELFRNPTVFQSIKENILPYLASYPRLDIWIAGCSKGEEAYSLAILLAENGLLERSYIHATDINTQALEQARSGVLTNTLNREDASRYNQAGGEYSLSRYFSTAYGKVKLSQELLDRITFSHHNLIQEAEFCSAQLVLCRNVMIYFDSQLQEIALKRLFNSIVDRGFLVIGPKENIHFSAHKKRLKTIDRKSQIYQRKSS